MEKIGETELWSFCHKKPRISRLTNDEIREASGCPVSSYLDLATKVAELQFQNWNHVLLFRGQGSDFRNIRNRTSLKPSLFRADHSEGSNSTWEELLRKRFSRLNRAELKLIESFKSAKIGNVPYLRRYRIIRWAILQHYDVCKTPLLDVTHSLRIAASFASTEITDQAYVFVLGVPNLSGAITVSAEGGLQVVRLASACPPEAVRPHIQEGYLLGEYPDTDCAHPRRPNLPHEIDFGQRLIAKFYFNPKTFWRFDSFQKIPVEELYPDASDPLSKIVEDL